MTLATVAVPVLGTCLGGFIQGLSGFDFALTAMAVWVWFVQPQIAAPMVVWGFRVGQVPSSVAVRCRIDLRRALAFVLGGALGVPLGAALLPHIDVRLIRGGVGVLLIVWCSVMPAATHLPMVTRGGRVADAAVVPATHDFPGALENAAFLRTGGEAGSKESVHTEFASGRTAAPPWLKTGRRHVHLSRSSRERSPREARRVRASRYFHGRATERRFIPPRDITGRRQCELHAAAWRSPRLA